MRRPRPHDHPQRDRPRDLADPEPVPRRRRHLRPGQLDADPGRGARHRRHRRARSTASSGSRRCSRSSTPRTCAGSSSPTTTATTPAACSTRSSCARTPPWSATSSSSSASASRCELPARTGCVARAGRQLRRRRPHAAPVQAADLRRADHPGPVRLVDRSDVDRRLVRLAGAATRTRSTTSATCPADLYDEAFAAVQQPRSRRGTSGSTRPRTAATSTTSRRSAC